VVITAVNMLPFSPGILKGNSFLRAGKRVVTNAVAVGIRARPGIPLDNSFQRATPAVIRAVAPPVVAGVLQGGAVDQLALPIPCFT